MKENLKNLKLLNRKGGCMLRKVLSVLVICCFMFTNVCFAMSTVAGFKATVDNIALRSVLDPNAPQGDLTNVTTLFNSLAGQDMSNMWNDNLAKLKVVGNTIVAGDLVIEVSAEGDTNQIKLTMPGQASKYIRIENGSAQLLDTPLSNASGKATAGNEQNLRAKFEAATNINDDAEKTAQTKSRNVSNLEARLNRGIEAGRLSADEIQQAQGMIAASKAAELNLTKGMVYENEDNYINGSNNGATAAKPTVFVNGELSSEAGSDVFDHEIVESVLGSDDAALVFLMKVDGITDRKNGNNQMSATYTELKNAVKAAETVQPQTLSDVSLPESLVSEKDDAKVVAAVSKAMDDAGLPQDQIQAAKENPKAFANVVRDMVAKGFAAIRAELANMMNHMYETYFKTSATDFVAAAKGVPGINEGGVIILNDYRDIGTMINGVFTIKEGAMEQMLTIKAGNLGNKFAVTGSGNDKAAVEKTFKAMGINDMMVLSGNDNSFEIRDAIQNEYEFIAIYSQKDAFVGTIEGVKYFQIGELANKDVNIMSVIVKVMQSIQHGTTIFKTDGSLDVAFDEIKMVDSEAFKADYTKFVAVLNKA